MDGEGELKHGTMKRRMMKDMEDEDAKTHRMPGGRMMKDEDMPGKGKKKKSNPFAIANAMAKKHDMGAPKKERLIRHLKNEYGEA